MIDADNPRDTGYNVALSAAMEDARLRAEAEDKERVLYEKYMADDFIIGTKEEALSLLRRSEVNPNVYALPGVEDFWSIWKARAAISRNEVPFQPATWTP